MVNNKEEIIKSFKSWVTQTAREQECKDNEIVNFIRTYIYCLPTI